MIYFCSVPLVVFPRQPQLFLYQVVQNSSHIPLAIFPIRPRRLILTSSCIKTLFHSPCRLPRTTTALNSPVFSKFLSNTHCHIPKTAAGLRSFFFFLPKRNSNQSRQTAWRLWRTIYDAFLLGRLSDGVHTQADHELATWLQRHRVQFMVNRILRGLGTIGGLRFQRNEENSYFHIWLTHWSTLKTKQRYDAQNDGLQ